MGLAADLMHGVSGQPEFVASMWKDAIAMEREMDAWVADLRAAGVKAAHPDDGWVDRQRNRVTFAYPRFNDGVKVGDLVALGSPRWGMEKPQHRIVRLTGREPAGLFSPGEWRWFFEVVDTEGVQK